VIAIDGVYSNPAGIAFMPQGFHLSVSWQAAWQKRQINSTFAAYPLNGGAQTKDFEGVAKAPIIPSFQAAYVINDKWSVSAQFAVGGGGGKCEFDNGLPMFEKLVYSNAATGVNAMIPGASVARYGLNQKLTGEQYFYGVQVGGTYKLADNFSVFGGVRTVLASCSYVGGITGINGDVKLPDAMGGIVMPNQIQSDDLLLDCSQSGTGFTPIIGLDWNLGKLNLAAKYEFRTKINLENESSNTPNVDAMMPAYANKAKVRSDIPAILTLGAQYQLTDAVRVMGGFHYYWDKDAKAGLAGSSKLMNYGDNTWEANLGLEWDVNDKVLLSIGGQRTQYGFDDADMVDTSFNISSTAVCVGGAYKFSEKMKLNVGYMHSFYGEHEVANQYGKDIYTRKNDVIGASLDITF
jgi:long-chain fatty acid transport protein